MLEGHNLLLLGQAGTGKTATICKFEKLLSEKGLNVCMTASTGIAAARFRGTTLHRFAGILDMRHSSEVIIAQILHNDDFAATRKRILKTDCVIIDEISMVSEMVMRTVDETLRGVRSCSLPFGGIQVGGVNSHDHFFQRHTNTKHATTGLARCRL